MNFREDRYITNVVASASIVGLICLYLEWGQMDAVPHDNRVRFGVFVYLRCGDSRFALKCATISPWNGSTKEGGSLST